MTTPDLIRYIRANHWGNHIHLMILSEGAMGLSEEHLCFSVQTLFEDIHRTEGASELILRIDPEHGEAMRDALFRDDIDNWQQIVDSLEKRADGNMDQQDETDKMIADIEAILNEDDDETLPERDDSVRGAPTLRSKPRTADDIPNDAGRGLHDYFLNHDPIIDRLTEQIGRSLPSAEDASEPVHRIMGQDARDVQAAAERIIGDYMDLVEMYVSTRLVEMTAGGFYFDRSGTQGTDDDSSETE